jgi:hypothetical protein
MSIAVSIIAAAVTTGTSIGVTALQNKRSREATLSAAASMADARKRLDKNYYDQLAVNIEPYRRASEAAKQTYAQQINAASFSDRGAASVGGRVLAASNERQMNIADAMSQELEKIEQLKATEDARLADLDMNLHLAETEGAQIAAAQADEQMFGTINNAVGTVAQLPMNMAKSEVIDAKYGSGGNGGDNNAYKYQELNVIENSLPSIDDPTNYGAFGKTQYYHLLPTYPEIPTDATLYDDNLMYNV